jgi:hypothetical protein
MAAFAAIPKFASGGLAYAPTLAMVGDNRNARTDPEVISPLSKLKNMIGDTGGAQFEQVGVNIRGTDLEIVLQRVARNKYMRT